MKNNINTDEIRTYYMRLNHGNFGVTELRAIGKTPETTGQINIGFFDDEDAFVDACEKFNHLGYNLYTGRNPRFSSMFDKAPNTMRRGIGGGSAEDVSAVTAIAIDIDPVRPKGLPATDEELEWARSLGENIVSDFPGSWLEMTGNGVCVWMPIDPVEIARGDAGRVQIQSKLVDFEKHILHTYLIGDYKDKVAIDKISDLPRINKVVGTVSHKGTATDDRPHRVSCFFSIPDVSIVSGLTKDILSGRYSMTMTESFIETSSATAAPKHSTPTVTVQDYKVRQFANRAVRTMCPPLKDLFENPGLKGDRSQGLHLIFQYVLAHGFSFEDALSVVYAADKGEKFGNRWEKASEYFAKDYDELKRYAGSGDIMPPCKKVKQLFKYDHCQEPRQLGLFEGTIKKIISSIEVDPEADDRELHLMTSIKENNLIDMLATLDDAQCEGYLGLLKNRFGLNKSWIELLRKDIKKIKKEMPKSVPETESTEVKTLTPDEEEKALEYLRDPHLIDRLLNDLKEVSGVIGQDNNLMLMYASFTSRLFDDPFSFILYGRSSSGKSYQANGVIETMPPEETMILSSASAKAFEYCSTAELKHKAILIQEFDGAKDSEATIRVMQSEGKLCRLNTYTDTTTGKRAVDRTMIDAPCVVAVTTTLIKNNDENETRIFKLYADETIEQTQNVVRLTMEKFTLEEMDREAAAMKKKAMLQDVQRVLSPLKVFIPYATLLKFPDTMTRNRRDSKRFGLLIKAFALLRQCQKEIKHKDGVPYIEADALDYEYAYRFGKDTLKNTLSAVSERELRVFEVAYKYVVEQKPAVIKDITFTIKAIQRHAKEVGVDLENASDLRKNLKALTEAEYLELVDGGNGKTFVFRLVYMPEVDGEGNIQRDDLVKNLTSPAELRRLLGQ